jgi:hypothetical protein
MKLKFVTTLSNPKQYGWLKLEKSLKEYGWDYHGIVHKWTGYLSKITQTYEHLKKLKLEGYTHFVYSDSYDSLCFGSALEVELKMFNKQGLVFSTEKACYPYPDWAIEFPESESPWKYLNGGGWYGSIDAYIRMVETDPPVNDLNDQVWSQRQFLHNNPDGYIQLEYGCAVFQTYAFHALGDFELSDGRVRNLITDSQPVFLHFNGHTKADEIYALKQNQMNIIEQVQEIWKDDPDTHRLINETFVAKVDATPYLKAHRDWVEANVFGFGERSFHWMWKLIIDKMPPTFSFLEIGVFRGQVLSLVQILANQTKRTPQVYGVTPLTGADGHWESDYEADIKKMHDQFDLPQPIIIKGLSTEPEVIADACQREYDIVYIDGGHTYKVVKSDLWNYSKQVKLGGYLVIDDCANKYHMPFGYFQGIKDVSTAVDAVLPNIYFEEIFSVVHNRIFKRIL